jgi:hypothetical protein
MVDTGAVSQRRTSTPLRLLLGALAIAALGAACSSTGYSYVKNSDDKTYFKVPDKWTLYEEEELSKSLGLSPRELEQFQEGTWQVGFDASPKPSLKHLLDPRSKHPTGIASVEQLDFDASDNASIVALRNQFLDVDSAVQAGDAEILSYEMLEPDGGFHGFHLVVDIAVDGGRTITFDQTSLLDQSASKVYNLIVTCGARCYADNADQIDRVVGSWTVEA